MQRLLDVKRTQIQMVRDRGYNIESERPVLEYDITQFSEHVQAIQQQLTSPDSPRPTIRSAISRTYVSNDKTQQLLVYYGASTEGKELPVLIVRDFLHIMRVNGIQNGILIGEKPLSFSGRKEINEYMAESTAQIQIFKESDLTFNATEHQDVPVHELVPTAEEAQLLRSMKTDKRHMLVMKVSDPIVQYYNWHVGRVVRIYRNDSAVSVLAPLTVNYRVIVP